jgi:hypothetical protein
VRDRRNPEIILSRENLIRSIDYNLNPESGEIFFMRQIPAFDYLLNLVQVVAAYEHRGTGSSNYVLTGRASRTFGQIGLRVGASYINQQQAEIGAFQLGGIDLEKTLPRGGRLNFEAALSNGRFASGVNVFDFYNSDFGGQSSESAALERNGSAIHLQLDQPLPLFQSRLRADFQRSTAGFFNPFGASIAAGNQRLSIGLEMRPDAKNTFTLGLADERNNTSNVSNSRRTFSGLWSRAWRENLRTVIGFDHRQYSDALTTREVDSNLITAAVEYRPTNRLEISAKREQNLGEADPTYPDQTILAAKYQLNPNAKLFFTQRLAAAPITPIGDPTGTGFSSTGAKRETAFGIETRISRLGALSGRYQLENGSAGTDTFAVIGLQNRWAVSKKFSLEAGFERGFLMSGPGNSFNSGTFGGSWTPGDGFRTSARYELRDRNGLGQLLTVGAAGKIGENWTTLARGQWTRSNFNQRGSASSTLTGALAYRPLHSDKYALLLSYNNRAIAQTGALVNGVTQAALRDRTDTVSADGLYQVYSGLELYGRFATRFNGNGDNTNIYASALTYSGQLRVQQRVNNYLDLAAEGRSLMQPSSGTRRSSLGAELGFWVIPDIRFGLGYNFLGVREPVGPLGDTRGQSGFYFTITTKLSNLFNLFGTEAESPATPAEEPSKTGTNGAPK